jgi:AraC family transcriptional regulator
MAMSTLPSKRRKKGQNLAVHQSVAKRRCREHAGFSVELLKNRAFGAVGPRCKAQAAILTPRKLLSKNIMLFTHGRHHGMTQARLDFDDFSILRQHYDHNVRSRPHAHEHAKIVTVFGGSAVQSSGSGDQERLPGMHRFHLAGERHADRIGPRGWETLIIEFQPAWVEAFPQVQTMFSNSLHTQYAEAYVLAKQVAQSLTAATSLGARLRACGLTYELLATFLDMQSEAGARKPRWLLQAHEYMCETYRSRPSVEGIARAVNVHPVHLTRTFRAAYGMTVAAFMRHLVVKEAVALLRKDSRSIAQIARSFGYTPAHFVALVHRATGVKPHDLR